MVTLWFALCLTLLQPAQAARQTPVEGDFVLKNFRFTSGETLPELRMHYRTYGTPRKDAQGVVRNAVLIMHGTGGTGGQFTGRRLRGELFGPGSRSTPRSTSSSCPTTSATAGRASRATACARSSRATATSTWSRRSTGS